MSQTVDNRVVEMEFDNAEFERGISTSIASLERLKESLNFEGAVKGFDALSNFENSGKEGFENLKKGAERVQASFSGMQIVGYTALQELTKGVMGLGIKLLNFLAAPLAQIEAGGKKRAQNIEQARFQMQGLGLDVEEAMRNSLDAVDGTAYGLDAAAKAAGQLAASGVALGKDMTTSLRGIAGVASMTSSQFEEISPIFTTVAGQGKLMTMQLRQLENRGINAAATMAKAFGTTEAAVRQMVTDGEVSFEMFSKAMSDAFGDQATKANDTYAGSLMNVRAALSRIGAKFYAPYYENMRQTLNELRLVINAISAGLDPLFQFTERLMILSRTLAVNRLANLDFSGMAEGLMKVLIPTIDILVNLASGLSGIFKAIGTAWRNVFPPASITPVIHVLEYIAQLTSNFGLSEKNLGRLTNTMEGFFSMIKLVAGGIGLLLKGLGILVNFLGVFVGPILTPLLAIVGAIGNFISGFVKAIEYGRPPMEAFSFQFDLLVIRLSAASKTFSGAGELVNSALNGIGKAVSFVADVLKNVDLDFRPLTVFAGEVDGSLATFTNQNGNVFDRAAEGVRTGLTNFKDAFSVVDSKFSSFVHGIGEGFAEALSSLGKAVDAVRPILEAGGKVISYFFNLIREAFEGVTVIDVINTGFFAGLVIVIRNFLKPLKDFSRGVVDLMDAARGALEAYQKNLMPDILLAIGGAVLMLAGAFFIMAQVPREKLMGTLIGVSVLLAEVTAAMLILSRKVGDKNITKLAVSMTVLSSAVWILAKAVAVLGQIDLKQAAIGVAGISILLWELVAISVVLKNAQADMVKGSSSLLFFSSSLYIMAFAVKNLGSMDIETLKTGLLSIAGLIAMLGLFMKSTEKSMAQMPAFAAGLLLMAAALNLLVLPLLLLGKIPWQILAQGLTVITATLTIVAFAANAMQSVAGQMTRLGAGLLLLAVALNLLVAPLLILSVIPLEVLGRGLLILTALLAMLAASAMVMGPIQGQLIAVAAGLSLLAIAVNLLLIPLITLGAMPFDNIVTGLTALAGLFLVLGVAAMALAPISGGLLVVAGGLALIGLAANLAGAGFMLLAAGVSALGLSLSGVATVLPVLLTALKSLFNQMVESVQVVIISIVNSLGVILTAIVKALMQVIIDASPKLFELLRILMKGVIDLITTYGPKLIELAMNLVMAFVQGIEARTEDFVEAALGIIENLLKGLADGIPGVAEAGADLIIAFLDAIASQNLRIVQAAFDIAIDFIQGLTATFKTRGPELSDAMSELAGAMLQTFVDVIFAPGKGIFETGQNIVTGVIDGIKDKFGALKEAASNAGKWVLDALNGKLEVSSPSKATYRTGGYAADGLVNGVSDKMGEIKSVGELSGSVLEGAFGTSLDKIIPKSEKTGEEAGTKMAEGINKSKGKVSKSAKELAEEAAEAAEAARKAFEASAEWISDEKYYNRLALADELAAWQRVQARYLKGTEERKKADKEVYRLSKEINQLTESYEQRRLDLDTQRTEKRKRLEEDYYAKVKEINDKLASDIKSLNQKYEDSVKSRADTLYKTYGLFDAVDPLKEVSSEDLLNNLQGQVDAFDAWQRDINSLVARGVDEGLIKELQAMGPKSASEVAALISMTDDQLSTYQYLWGDKHSQINEVATSEMESLRLETEYQIDQLNAATATQLEEYKKTWEEQMAAVSEDTKKQLETLELDFKTKMYGVRVSTEAEFMALGKNIAGILDNARPKAEKVISTLSTNMQTILKSGNWVGVGENVIYGVIAGIRNKQGELETAVRNMAQAAEDAANAQLDINSPSGKFEDIGEYTGLGFINGLQSMMSKIKDTSKGLGQTAMDGLNSAISKIVDMVENDTDCSPVIRPVLDLDAIQNGMSNISDILNQDYVLAAKIANNENPRGINSEKQISAQAQGPVYQFTQNNYSPKALSRIDIYRQTKNQFSTLKEVVNPI